MLMYRGPVIGKFTTYGIIDPRFGYFVYVGQTCDFEKRKQSHLRKAAEGRKRPRITEENVKTWTFDAVSAGITPVIVPLETTGTWQESLKSESEWVRRLAAENHPLLNKWKEHVLAIRQAAVSEPMRARTFDVNIASFPPKGSSSIVSVYAPGRKLPEERRARRKLQGAAENHGKAWTKALDDQLIAYFQMGLGANEMASKARRTQASVRARLVRLGMLAERQDLPD